MKENINTVVTKEIYNFCKSIFEKYPEVTGIKIHGKNSKNMTISIRSTLVR